MADSKFDYPQEVKTLRMRDQYGDDETCLRVPTELEHLFLGVEDLASEINSISDKTFRWQCVVAYLIMKYLYDHDRINPHVIEDERNNLILSTEMLQTYLELNAGDDVIQRLKDLKIYQCFELIEVMSSCNDESREQFLGKEVCELRNDYKDEFEEEIQRIVRQYNKDRVIGSCICLDDVRDAIISSQDCEIERRNEETNNKEFGAVTQHIRINLGSLNVDFNLSISHEEWATDRYYQVDLEKLFNLISEHDEPIAYGLLRIYQRAGVNCMWGGVMIDYEELRFNEDAFEFSDFWCKANAECSMYRRDAQFHKQLAEDSCKQIRALQERVQELEKRLKRLQDDTLAIDKKRKLDSAYTENKKLMKKVHEPISIENKKRKLDSTTHAENKKLMKK